MIARFVHMTFHENNVDQFLNLFSKYKSQIRTQPGCKLVHLIQDPNYPTHISTYSVWDSESDLNNYRMSSIFGEVWPKTKILFAKKPSTATLKLLSF